MLLQVYLCLCGLHPSTPLEHCPLYLYFHLHCSFTLHLLQLIPDSLHHPPSFLSYILIRSLSVCVCVCAYEPGPAVVNEVNMVARQTSPPPSFSVGVFFPLPSPSPPALPSQG